ncbi:ATP-binding protein [Sporosarcina thermotolerans]|uniref:sensor histidine kinase n=1 Tax=Sporosarcina thermotolerans TaxID=633404 RepID=UPI0024BD0254|nr:ATP-binding protein [Sporosarcina thermotolerans]WHT48634.1 ATP-binding protein [Sporosarcina thermotolerans]
MDPKRFNLDGQLMEIIRRHRWLLEEKQISLAMEMDEIEFSGDPAFLEKVWENLLSNALKYTSTGGEIEINLIDDEENVLFKIRDTGVGIPEEHLKRLFDRFYRVDHSRTQEIEGTGLGLSIVHQVVKLHRGNVEVESQEGVGTVFIVVLPKL